MTKTRSTPKLTNRAQPLRSSGETSQDVFKKRQADLLASQAKIAPRAPGRVRVDTIIDTTIELLAEHARKDITIAMIATKAGIRRTSVYAHFSHVDEVFEQIALRFVQQVGLHVEEYVRTRKPATLIDVVVLTIDAIQEHFNRPDPDVPGARAAHIPFDARHVIQDFDRVSALTYHSLWEVDWPVEPLSENDPFRLLVTVQSAIFDTSLRYHQCITDSFAQEAKSMAIDFINRTERRFAPQNVRTGKGSDGRLLKAVRRIEATGDARLQSVAASQIEALTELASLYQTASGQPENR